MILYDNDFQSYSIGDTQPFGLLVKGNVLNSDIIPAVPPLFTDTQGVSIPSLARSLIFPFSDPPDPLTTTFYPDGTVTFAINLTNSTPDQQGTLLNFVSTGTVGAGSWFVSICQVRMLSDGTIAITTENNLNYFGVSDFSCLCNQWYWFQIDVTFSLVTGFIHYNINIAVNGVDILTKTNVNTGIANGDVNGYPLWDAVAFGGVGQGTILGRVTIYDSRQPKNTYAHVDSPTARLNQGVIELIKRKTLPQGNTRIYEA